MDKQLSTQRNTKQRWVHTFTIPRVITLSSFLLSQRGYKMTVKADINVQIIPMTTHASSPRLPKTVEAKNKGSGMRMIMITACAQIANNQ